MKILLYVLVGLGWLSLNACTKTGTPEKFSPPQPTIKENTATSCQLPSQSPELPVLPPDFPQPRPLVSYNRIDYLDEGWNQTSNFGVGYLGLGRRGSDPAFSWFSQVALPLYDRPNGKFWGWLACGWLVTYPEGEPKITSFEPTVIETSYETVSLIVLESNSDGWFHFRYADADETGSGTAWTHTSYLGSRLYGLGNEPLVVERWETTFLYLKPYAAQVPLYGLFFFRKPGRYALHKQPRDESEVIVWLEDEQLIPLNIEGDWMQVQTRPNLDNCQLNCEKVNVGWIRWWNSEVGPLLWYYTRD